MEELLIFLIQILIEALAYFPWDILLYSRSESGPPLPKLVGWALLSLLAGVFIGGLSALVFAPHVLLKYGWLRVLNLVLAPYIAGALATKFALKRVGPKNPHVIRLHFWSAVMFTFGLVVVRFAYASR